MSPPLTLQISIILTFLYFLGNFISFQFCKADDSSAEFLNAHNIARIEVGVGVGNLTWDDGVAAFAELYAKKNVNKCRIMGPDYTWPFGENLVSSGCSMSAAEAVHLWVNEKEFYKSNTNSCAPDMVCEGYLQVVSKNTIKLGCSKERCLNGGTFITC